MSRRYRRSSVQITVAISSAGNIGRLGIVSNVSIGGCCVETSGDFSIGDLIQLALLQPNTTNTVRVVGTVTYVLKESSETSTIGVKLEALTEPWFALIRDNIDIEAQPRSQAKCDKQHQRVLVVGDRTEWEEAQNLSSYTGWNIHFATDVRTLVEVLDSTTLDALVCDYEIEGNDWRSILQITRFKQPDTRRIFRCRAVEAELPSSGPNELVHRVVKHRGGMEALLDVLTAELGTSSSAGTL